jgi:hypothetical protein
MVNYTNCATVQWRNKVELEVVKENEDGSIDVILSNIEPRMLQLLMQEGLISLLHKELERMEKENKIPALLKPKKDEV